MRNVNTAFNNSIFVLYFYKIHCYSAVVTILNCSICYSRCIPFRARVHAIRCTSVRTMRRPPLCMMRSIFCCRFFWSVMYLKVWIVCIQKIKVIRNSCIVTKRKILKLCELRSLTFVKAFFLILCSTGTAWKIVLAYNYIPGLFWIFFVFF